MVYIVTKIICKQFLNFRMLVTVHQIKTQVATATARKASIAPTKNKLVDNELAVTGLGKLYHIISSV